MAQDGVGAASETRLGAARAVGLERAQGETAVSVRRREDGASRLHNLRQSGAAKCFLPKIHDPVPVAVLVNTAGGLTGGDSFTADAKAEDGAALTMTTQTAERVYRAVDDDAAKVRNSLALGSGAQLNWLPQETILFDGGRLDRLLDIEMEEDAELLALEMITLGRRAMGETVVDGYLGDQWRVRRGGRLVFADALRLTGPIDKLLEPMATGGGARAAATMLYVAPDAEDRLESVRARIDELSEEETKRDGDEAKNIDLGASAWDKLLVIRMIAGDPAPLRRILAALVRHFRGAPPPITWSL